MRELYKRAAPHIDRVRLDGGVPTDNVQELLLLKRSNEELKNVLRLSYCPELHGNKIRTSGVNNFITKGYDEATSNDLTQTVSANQPFLDKIAPNEKLGSKNPNGGIGYFEHTPIAFGANDKWTIEVTFNWNASYVDDYYRQTIALGVSTAASISLQTSKNTHRLRFYNGVTVYNFAIGTSTRLIGKTNVMHMIASGAGDLSAYINGALIGSIQGVVTNMPFTHFMGSAGVLQYTCSATFFSYHIFAKELTESEVKTRTAVLRSIFNEIPFTRIGEQIWSVRNYEATVTPMGNGIPEVQLASNVEKITNAADRDFTSDTGFWIKSSTVTLNNGVCTIVSNGSDYQALTKSGLLITGKWYKFTYSIVANRGGSLRLQSLNTITVLDSSVGSAKVAYLYADDPQFRIVRHSLCDIDIDNVSVQEVGWADSQNLYDYIYANTTGTVEQKTYAACKAAAMWCHYNNDATLGATYGKLYNWFAVKLLQMDIDYFNAANPTTPWGWRVPTQADFDTLATTLGGATVAGGKMKLSGTTYWYSPNVGADNASGFSAIGSGRRPSNGVFVDLTFRWQCGTSTLAGANPIAIYVDGVNTTLTSTALIPPHGVSIRLIKTNQNPLYDSLGTILTDSTGDVLTNTD